MQGRVLIALVPASFVSWSGSGIVYVEYMRALSQANNKTDTSCLQTVFAAQRALALFRFRNRCMRWKVHSQRRSLLFVDRIRHGESPLTLTPCNADSPAAVRCTAGCGAASGSGWVGRHGCAAHTRRAPLRAAAYPPQIPSSSSGSSASRGCGNTPGAGRPNYRKTAPAAPT